MRRRIFRAILLCALSVLIICIIVVTGFLNAYFDKVLTQDLKNELILISEGVEEHGLLYLQDLDPETFHLTWIQKDGEILYDTHTLEGSVENPADKEKVLEAFANKDGKSSRYATAFTEKYIYCATELSDETILCASVSEVTSAKLVWGLVPYFLVLILSIIVLAWILADRMTKGIMYPLNHLNLEAPLENEVYEEIVPLLQRIAYQNQEIQTHVRHIQKNAEEFNRITEGMHEGLVLLDNTGKILSMNLAAQQIFGVSEDAIGRIFIGIDRHRDLNYAILSAHENGYEEIRCERNGRMIQFDISSIEVENDSRGTAILAFDVTDKDAVERRRQEFSANVSHELKTPLQGIIGSAELLENQLIAEEDIPRFVGHIKSEAQRLLVMIQDIIGLSQLESDQEFTKEKVSLKALAEEIIQELQPIADQKNIQLHLQGDTSELYGVRKFLYSIIYNLCDNSIKYNQEGGNVWIQIHDKEARIELIIKDNGIGIAPEHMDRIFERFYRVDKSHSRQSGGTGLGLSIVKHAVKYHHGKIQIQSESGVGTSIKIILKKT